MAKPVNDMRRKPAGPECSTTVLRLCIVYVLVDQICWSFPVDHCEIGYKNENDDDDNIAATDDAFEITSKWRIHSINQENLWSPFFIFLQKTFHESS